MTNHVKDLIGKRFGKLKVIKFDSIRGVSKHSYWICKCDCGNKKVIRGSHLKGGTTISCNCYRRKKASIWLKKYASSDKHKGKGNPMWNGVNPEYSTIHQWLTRNFKKDKCEFCGITKKRFDWAKKRGFTHSKNRRSYMCLCRSCHRLYDSIKRKEDFRINLYKK